jgi:hypothetical protein
VASSERKFDATPKLIVLSDGVRVIVEDAEVVLSLSSANKDPHAFYRNRLLGTVHRNAEDQLDKIARLKRLPPLQIGEPKRFRRFTMEGLTVI